MKIRFVLAASVALALAAEAAAARDQARVVGSSTVYPFSVAVAQAFGEKTSFAAPVIEQTGSSDGLAQFCAGIGPDTPDIANASRRITADEWKLCNENDVTDIIEIKIGFDGIVIGNASAAPEFDLTQVQIYRALAEKVAQYGRLDNNGFTAWNEVDLALPAIPIKVYGPPPGSGTREAFEELALIKGGRLDAIGSAALKSLKVREDGAYIAAPEDDARLLSRLEADPTAVGIFGYALLVRYPERLKGAKIDSVAPGAETIADGVYALSRPLYIYLKRAHIGVIPGLEEYFEEFMSDPATGEGGYVSALGLVALDKEERAEATETAANLAVMTGDEKLK